MSITRRCGPTPISLNLANPEGPTTSRRKQPDNRKRRRRRKTLTQALHGRNTDSTLSQYGTMVQILNAWRKGDIQTAVQLYIGLDQSKITDESMAGVLGELQGRNECQRPSGLRKPREPRARPQAIMTRPLTTTKNIWRSTNKNPQIIFNMAMIYKTKGDEETAEPAVRPGDHELCRFTAGGIGQGRAGILCGDRRMPDEKDLTEEKLQVFFYVIGKETYYGTIIYL